MQPVLGIRQKKRTEENNNIKITCEQAGCIAIVGRIIFKISRKKWTLML